MTKRIFPTLFAILLALFLSACADGFSSPTTTTPSSTTVTTTTTTATGTQDTTTAHPHSTTVVRTISPEQAKSIALQHANLTDATVHRVDAERDRERCVLVYEVEFEHRGYEYSYDIHAETGEILWYEKERDD